MLFPGVLSQKESPKKTLVEESVEIFTDPPKKQMPDEKKSEDSESSNENSMASSSGKTTTDEDKSKSQADDTDSASNGSGVRRSSRIRTIGLMKQRYTTIIKKFVNNNIVIFMKFKIN